jgi:hypothetical protein
MSVSEATPLFMPPVPLQLLSSLQVYPFTAAQRVADLAACETK